MCVLYARYVAAKAVYASLKIFLSKQMPSIERLYALYPFRSWPVVCVHIDSIAITMSMFILQRLKRMQTWRHAQRQTIQRPLHTKSLLAMIQFQYECNSPISSVSVIVAVALLFHSLRDNPVALVLFMHFVFICLLRALESTLPLKTHRILLRRIHPQRMPDKRKAIRW